MKILITGGAGFIGSYLTQRLSSLGHEVVILDSLLHQVHGPSPESSSESYKRVKNIADIVIGNASSEDSYRPLFGVKYDAIYCLASETGTGQSMYCAAGYCTSNIVSVALLNDLIVSKKIHTERVILTSSRSVYGEAKVDNEGQPLPSKEDDSTLPASIYAASKLSQEMILRSGFKGCATTAYRLQNVYGPGQSLSNPYTGILSIFSNAILNSRVLQIFEDGRMSRDFIYVEDVVSGLLLSLKHETSNQIFNLGTGIRTSVLDVTALLAKSFEVPVRTKITGETRVGDIRHNYADITKISSLGYVPTTSLEEGISKFVKWVKSQDKITSNYEQSLEEMRKNHLLGHDC